MFPLFRKRKNRFAVFESMGVPGPKPSFIDGNQREVTAKVSVY